MNKSELIEAVSKTTSLAKRDAENAVNALVHTIVAEVKAGRRVSVVGFGAFRPTRRAARMGRNPQTGAAVRIPASKGVSFAASSSFKDIVNGKAPLGSPKVTVSAASRTAAASGAAKATAKKAPARKTAAKATAKKAPARKTVAKATAKKAPARKTVAKATAKKAPARKVVAKTAARKAPARTTVRTTGRTAKR